MNKKLNFKNNVQGYRVYKRLLQKDLAKETGISVSEISLIERQLVTPIYKNRAILCKYFGVSHDQLFYIDDNDDNDIDKKIAIVNKSTNKITKSKKESLDFLSKAGICDEQGTLEGPYK